MPKHIDAPAVLAAAGSPPKAIEEFVGHVNTPGDAPISVARMTSPAGWSEPGQTPEFEEITIVLEGRLVVDTKAGPISVSAGQALRTRPGEWVRYCTPDSGGAVYLAVCLPAFSPNLAHRDPKKATVDFQSERC